MQHNMLHAFPLVLGNFDPSTSIHDRLLGLLRPRSWATHTAFCYSYGYSVTSYLTQISPSPIQTATKLSPHAQPYASTTKPPTSTYPPISAVQ
jgi:hypothetical protein